MTQVQSIRAFVNRAEIWVRSRLWLQVVVALILGVVAGTLLGPDVGWVDSRLANDISNWLALPGKLFLGLITLVLEPLVFASIIQGLTGRATGSELRRVGSRLIAFVVLTTVAATALGLALATTINPGHQVSLPNGAPPAATAPAKATGEAAKKPSIKQVPSLIEKLIPTNPTKSILDRDLLAIVLIAILLGLAARQADRELVAPFLNFMNALLGIAMTIVKWAMFLTPWAVFGLMAQAVSKVGLATLGGLGAYVGTVLIGLLALYLLYLLLVWVFARRSPLWFARNIGHTQLLAFSTSSSAAVMPVSIETAVTRLGVRDRIASLVVPLGATINMAGTALYQAIAVLFLAQLANVTLEVGDLALIVVTLVAASIGAPGTPGVSVVILSTVVTGFGIPAAGLVLVLGVDRLLDMARTVVNVTGDLAACVILRNSLDAETAAAPPAPDPPPAPDGLVA